MTVKTIITAAILYSEMYLFNVIPIYAMLVIGIPIYLSFKFRHVNKVRVTK